jgi:hypothetical protein
MSGVLNFRSDIAPRSIPQDEFAETIQHFFSWRVRVKSYGPFQYFWTDAFDLHCKNGEPRRTAW